MNLFTSNQNVEHVNEESFDGSLWVSNRRMYAVSDPHVCIAGWTDCCVGVHSGETSKLSRKVIRQFVLLCLVTKWMQVIQDWR